MPRIGLVSILVAAFVPLSYGPALADGASVSGRDGNATVTVYQPMCFGSPETVAWWCPTADESVTAPIPSATLPPHTP